MYRQHGASSLECTYSQYGISRHPELIPSKHGGRSTVESDVSLATRSGLASLIISHSKREYAHKRERFVFLLRCCRQLHFQSELWSKHNVRRS